MDIVEVRTFKSLLKGGWGPGWGEDLTLDIKFLGIIDIMFKFFF